MLNLMFKKFTIFYFFDKKLGFLQPEDEVKRPNGPPAKSEAQTSGGAIYKQIGGGFGASASASASSGKSKSRHGPISQHGSVEMKM